MARVAKPVYAVGLTHGEYLSLRYFPGLDGIRALSVVAVLTVHSPDNLPYGDWNWLGGEAGVGAFFVLSGFLITTLALREESERGYLSLSAFYVRRTMRIFPAYYYWLGVTLLLAATAGGVVLDQMLAALGYYVLYLGEYAPAGLFYHSWSLGIEEKFYLAWPVCFVWCRGWQRFAVAGLCMFLPFPQGWVGYPRIMAGCVLALALHEERIYRWLERLSSGWLAPLVLVAWHVPAYAGEIDRGLVQIGYTLALTYFILTAVVARPFWLGWLEARALVYLGRRSYGMYLVHVVVVPFVTLFPAGSGAWWAVAVNLVAAVAATALVAGLLYRLVEDPLRRVGVKWSNALLDRCKLRLNLPSELRAR